MAVMGVVHTGQKNERSPNAPMLDDIDSQMPEAALRQHHQRLCHKKKSPFGETQNKNEAEQIELDRWPTASCFHMLRTGTKNEVSRCFRHPRAALEWTGEVEGATCLKIS